MQSSRNIPLYKTNFPNAREPGVYAYPLDLLRIFAAVAVVLYHWDDSIFVYGYLGVDIFLLISGYLVGGMILQRFKNNQFFFLNFYFSRLIRLLPALYVVLTVCTLFMVFLLTPIELEKYGRSLSSTVLNISNVYFYNSIDYFNPISMSNPLIHMWSLSLEEQFYFIFPIYVYFLCRFGVDLMKGCILIFVVSFCGFLLYSDSFMAFYLLPFRMWEFGIGIFLYVYSKRFGSFFKWSAKGYVYCLLCIAFSWAFFGVFKYHNSFYLVLLFTLIFSCLYINAVANTTSSLVFKPLPWVKYLGGMSYSIYLWHMPIAAIFLIFSIKSGMWFILYFFLIIFLSFLTYEFVELKIKYALNKKFILRVLALVSLIMLSTGLLFHLSGGLSGIWKEVVSPVKVAKYEIFSESKKHSYEYSDRCRKNYRDDFNSLASAIRQCSENLGAPIVVVIGDSHGEDIFHALSNNFQEKYVIGFAKGGCRIFEKDPSCDFDKLASVLKDQKEYISHVIYSQAYFFLFDNFGSPSQRSYVRKLSNLEADQLNDENLTIHSPATAAIKSYLERLANDGLKVIYLGGWVDPMHETTFPQFSKNIVPVNKIQSVRVVYSFLDLHMLKSFQSSPVHFYSLISITPPFYGPYGEPYYSDSDHLSKFGESYLGAKLIEVLNL